MEREPTTPRLTNHSECGRSWGSTAHSFADPGFGWFVEIRFDRRVIRPATDGHHRPDIDLALNEVVRGPRPPEVVRGDMLPPPVVGLLEELLAGLTNPTPNGRCRGLYPGVVGRQSPFPAALVDVVGDGLGHPGVPDLGLAARRVLPPDFEEPHRSVLGPPGVLVGWVGDLVGPEPTPPHELHSDLSLPLCIPRDPFELVEFLGREPALRDGAGVVDPNHARIVLTRRL